jgi:hypothetical protein
MRAGVIEEAPVFLFLPLFTEVRGRGILRSPYAASCVDYPVGPPEGRLPRASSIEANTTYSGAG